MSIPLGPPNTWIQTSPCTTNSEGSSYADSIVVNGVPATIVAPNAWGITLNDGAAPPNFSIDQYDQTGALIESPIKIDGASGDVFVNQDPTQALGVATKHYVDTNAAGLTDAPDDGGLYGRRSLAWETIPPPSPLPVATTTILGGVKVDGTTIRAAPDGTVSTTVVPLGDNRIINGDMRIDQRNNGAGGSTLGYTVDRWRYSGPTAALLTWQRGAPTGFGFPYCINLVSSSAHTVAAADYFYFGQPIEADAISDFQWGTPNAQPVTLSFWASSSIAGTFGGALNATRSYPFTFPVTTAWTKIVITIPGDTGTPWTLSGGGLGVLLTFGLGVGSNFSALAGAWAAGNYISANGATNIMTTNGASLSITGVKLEIGSVATPFNRQSLAKSMADCQRYYSTSNLYFGAYGLTGGNIGQTLTFPATMRAAPTITPVLSTPTNSSGLTAYQSTNMGTGFYATVTATGMASAQCGLTMSAEL